MPLLKEASGPRHLLRDLSLRAQNGDGAIELLPFYKLQMTNLPMANCFTGAPTARTRCRRPPTRAASTTRTASPPRPARATATAATSTCQDRLLNLLICHFIYIDIKYDATSRRACSASLTISGAITSARLAIARSQNCSLRSPIITLTDKKLLFQSRGAPGSRSGHLLVAL